MNAPVPEGQEGTGDWTIKNLKFLDCQAIKCGYSVADGSNSDFSCGFDIQESNALENVQLINCLAEDNWENGFHCEPGWYLGTKNFYMENCVSRNNGQRKPADAPYRDSYLSGYYIHRNSVLKNCVSENNKNAGFFAHDGYTTTFDGCMDIGSTYGFKIVKGCKDITLKDCWSQDAKEWAFWGAFGDNIRLENFHQMNMGGKAVDGGAPTQSNIGWYYHDSQYHHSVSNSYFDITGYGPSIEVLNQEGLSNTYILNRASSQYPIPAHAEIQAKSIPPLPVAGQGGITPLGPIATTGVIQPAQVIPTLPAAVISAPGAAVVTNPTVEPTVTTTTTSRFGQRKVSPLLTKRTSRTAKTVVGTGTGSRSRSAFGTIRPGSSFGSFAGRWYPIS
jgi:hypothetical protein